MLYVILTSIFIFWAIVLISENVDRIKALYPDYKYFEDKSSIVEDIIFFGGLYVFILVLVKLVYV